MGFLGLGSDDPLTSELRRVFPNATLVAVPEERIAPMLAATVCHGKQVVIGEAKWLVKGDPLGLPDDFVRPSRMASLSGRRSRSVSVEVGLKVLDGVLNAFGIASPAITAKFSGAKQVSFGFENVVNLYVDTIALGRQLQGRVVDIGNPALTPYFGEESCPLLILNSTVTSSEFTISVEKSRNGEVELDVGAIQKVVGELSAAVSVRSAEGLALTFHGPQQLGFAFTAVRLYVDSDGRIVNMPPETLVPDLRDRLEGFIPPGLELEYAPDQVRLGPEEPALLEWDEDLAGEISDRAAVV